MNISHITGLDQVEAFLKAHQDTSFKPPKSKQKLYDWLDVFLSRIKYHQRKKKEKRLIKSFIAKVTAYSSVQIKRFISKHKKGMLRWKKWQTGEGRRKYTQEDLFLLHTVDEAHQLSGEATKELLRREVEVFGNDDFKRLAGISASHIYNLRRTVAYGRMGKVFSKTKPRIVNIGQRKKPEPKGRPGFLRVDTVHQGDKNKKKGVYYINVVDEITQWELVFCVEAISEQYLRPVLALIVKQFPFIVINFHSDNGGEYINRVVAGILNRLHIGQTKSRSRKSNDNALVESKNGTIVRKHYNGPGNLDKKIG